MRSVAAVYVMLVCLGCASGCGSSGGAAKSANGAGKSDGGLAKCVAVWSADATSVGFVAQSAASGLHTKGFMFQFAGGQCGLTVAGAGFAATYADIASNGHFEPWINTANGTPSPSVLPAAEALAGRAEAEPNVMLLRNGSVAALSGARLGRIATPVVIARNGLESPGPSNTAAYNINAAAWNSLTLSHQIALVSEYASQRYCPTAAVRKIAEAMREGTFRVLEDSVQNTLAQACREPDAFKAKTAPRTPDGATTGTPSGPPLSYLSTADRATLGTASYPVLLPAQIPPKWLGPGITSPTVQVPSPFSVPTGTTTTRSEHGWSVDFSNDQTGVSRAETAGVVVEGGPPQECSNQEGYNYVRCGVFKARGVAINKGEGNDDKGLYFWTSCGTGFAIDLTKTGGDREAQARRIIPELVAVPNGHSGSGC